MAAEAAEIALDRVGYGFPHDKIVYDQDGNGLKVAVVDGLHFPAFGERSIRKVRDMPLRDDDVLLIGYPKTGCHWTWEVLNMIVAGKGEHSASGKGVTFLEVASQKLIDSWSERRILNTHLPFQYIPKEAIMKKNKIIFTVRNPKDTAVSFYNHVLAMNFIYDYTGSFNSWFQLFVDGQVDYGSYFDYHQHWDQVIKDNPDLNIFVVSFEDMKEDLPREIRKMSKFLDVTLTDKQVDEIAKAAGFDTMKAAYGNSISNKLIRKGQVGDWKNWLTVAQSEIIDAKVEQQLKGTIFGSPRYVL